MKVGSYADVHALMELPRQTAALLAALQLGLFWRLADGPRSAAAIAREMAIPPRRCHYWLSLLAAMDLLEQKGDQFALLSAARTAIVDRHSEAAWRMLAIDAEDNLRDSLSLAQRLSDSGPDDSRPGRNELEPYVQEMAADKERARLFTRMLYELHTPLAQELAATLELDGARSLLDVGGGSGVVSLALLRKHPELTATVVDIANVCQAGREVADELPDRDRISYLAADFVKDTLPHGYDVVMLCDVGMFDDALLAKLAASLKQGGRLVIVDRWFDMDQNETPELLAQLLAKSLREPDYSLRSLEEVEDSVAKAGLMVEEIVGLSYGNWRMIEASLISEG